MTQTAHIYNPSDSSLEERSRAYQEVYQAWLNAEASMKLLDDEEWSHTLGERREVEQALDVTIDSMKIASQSFTREEIGLAKDAGLLEENEALELIQGKLQEEMTTIRDRQSKSQSAKHTQKR